jgi:hypothetical protein
VKESSQSHSLIAHYSHPLTLAHSHRRFSPKLSPSSRTQARTQKGSSTPSAWSSGPGPRLPDRSRANHHGPLCVTNPFSRYRVPARVALVAVGVPDAPGGPSAAAALARVSPRPESCASERELGPTRDSGVGVTCGFTGPISVRYQPQSHENTHFSTGSRTHHCTVPSLTRSQDPLLHPPSSMSRHPVIHISPMLGDSVLLTSKSLHQACASLEGREPPAVMVDCCATRTSPGCRDLR